MAKKKKQRFKVPKKINKKGSPIQTKPIKIGDIPTTRFRPISPAPTITTKLDSFEKSFLKIAKHIKEQKRNKNRFNQIAKNPIKPQKKQRQFDIDKSWLFGLKAQTPVQQGHTIDFRIIKNNSMAKAHELLNQYGQEGVKSLFKWTILKVGNENIKINKLINRFNKINKKEHISAKDIYDFNQQIRKAIKPIKLKSKTTLTTETISNISGFKQRRSYVENQKFVLEPDTLIEMTIRALDRDYGFDVNDDGEIEIPFDYYLLELEQILASMGEKMDSIFNPELLRQGRYVLNNNASQIYHRVRATPGVKVKPIIFSTQRKI